jgi:hypothetical protein
MTRLAGAPAPAAQSRTLEGGRTVIVFFALDFKRASDIPTTIAHTLHMRSPDGVEHALTVQPLVVQQRAPIVVAPPLRAVRIGSPRIRCTTASTPPIAALFYSTADGLL